MSTKNEALIFRQVHWQRPFLFQNVLDLTNPSGKHPPTGCTDLGNPIKRGKISYFLGTRAHLIRKNNTDGSVFGISAFRISPRKYDAMLIRLKHSCFKADTLPEGNRKPCADPRCAGSNDSGET
jgi:hypothetical protein